MSPPSCHCPCALCCSVSLQAPQPRTTKCPLEHPPLPSPVRVNPHIPQALPAGNGYPSPDCQFGPVRTRVQRWERIAAAVVAADTSPDVPLLGGCDRECRTIPGAALPRPWMSSVPSLLAPGWGRGLLSVSPPTAHPCPLSPSPGAGAVCAPPAAPRSCWMAGSSPGRKLCFLWVSQEELSPLGMSWGPPPRHKHFPLLRWLFFLSSVALERVAGDTEPSSPPRRRRRSFGYSRALDLVPPPDGKLGDPGDLCLAPGSLQPWGLQTCPCPSPWAVSL